ncbi:MAG TPA: hypothetical protein VFR67_21110 [Pilimelia sp.]|nr:hypothetical protein [Pilimelia sp.]
MAVLPESSGELGPDERTELERLRTEVAALRQRPARPPRRIGRSFAATLLIVLGCLLMPLAVTAFWLRSEVTDTDRYVATVAPLARDPAVQRAITDRVTTEIFSRIDIAGLTSQAADALAERGVPEGVATTIRGMARPIANGIQNWVHDQVARFVASDEFARAWEEANRTAHTQMVAMLTGENTGALVIEGDSVSVQLATVINAVKERLVANGFTLAERIPEVDAEFVIFQSADIGRAQRAFGLLDALGTWLPVLALALIAAGVFVASGKRRALIAAGLGVMLAMLLLGVGVAVARALYLNALPGDAVPSDAAAVVFDQIVTFLRTTLRTVLVVGLIVLAAAYLSGPAPAAVRTREMLRRGFAGVRGGAGRLGLRTGPVGDWVGRHRRGLRLATVAIAAAVLVFWDYATVAVVIWIVVATLVVLALLEIVATPAGAQAQPNVPREVGA